jgi:uncharacterized protein
MRLDLREIINIPGTSVSFDYEPDLGEAVGGAVRDIKEPVRAKGSIRNSAGVLHFEAEVEATVLCACARCLKEMELPIHLHVTSILTEGEEESDDPDVFLLEGDFADVDEIIVSNFILSLDQRFLCREDCKGLCERCGADLNKGPCSCGLKTDPRLAVLGRLLENE